MSFYFSHVSQLLHGLHIAAKSKHFPVNKQNVVTKPFNEVNPLFCDEPSADISADGISEGFISKFIS